jgi:histidinol dehydrogenase
MRVLRHSDPDFAAHLAALQAPSSLFDPQIEARAQAIIEAVRERGDEALLELTERFDGARIAAEQIPVTAAELMDASLRADESLRAAVKEAHRNIATFAKRSSVGDGRCGIRTGLRSARNLTRSTGSGFTFPAAPPHSFRRP